MTYGTHVDDALMNGRRTDMSFTIFLNDPASYDGGALVIEDTLENRSIRDPAQREILFDIEFALREVFERDGKSGLFDRLVKTRTNLLRLWADD
jgi:PKHD-type hydroxylase